MKPVMKLVYVVSRGERHSGSTIEEVHSSLVAARKKAESLVAKEKRWPMKASATLPAAWRDDEKIHAHWTNDVDYIQITSHPLKG